MPVVVVESPAKAKTINKYLGSDYTVLASYGHVRDLPPKDGSVDPDNDFDMLWEIGSDSKKHVKAIADALKNDNALILATDPDREGEAISAPRFGLPRWLQIIAGSVAASSGCEIRRPRALGMSAPDR